MELTAEEIDEILGLASSLKASAVEGVRPSRLAGRVLLATAVQVASVDGCQRCRPSSVLSEALGQQLVVPQAQRFQRLAPDRQNSHVHAVVFFGGDRSGGVVQRWVVTWIGLAEHPRHFGRPGQQRADIESKDGRGQQPDGRHHREPAANPVGQCEDI